MGRQLQRSVKAVEAYEGKKSWGGGMFGGKKAKKAKKGLSDDEDSEGGNGCGCSVM